MQKRQIVPHFCVPADQDTPEAIHPAGRALHPAPCPEAGLLSQCFGLFPPRSAMGGASGLGEPSTALLIIITVVQAHPLRCCRGELRPLDREALEGLPCPLDVMAVGAF